MMRSIMADCSMAEEEKEKKSNSVENEYHSRSPCFLLVI